MGDQRFYRKVMTAGIVSIIFIGLWLNAESSTRQVYKLRTKQHHSIVSKSSRYQADLVMRSKPFRPGAHYYAGFGGPWLENHFFDNWIQQMPVLDRIYVPIAWTDCLVNSPHLREDVQAFVNDLDPSFAYFAVAQLDRGFNHPSFTLHIPEHLDFWLFSSGGSSPPLRTTPIPLLKQELLPVGLPKSIGVSFQGSMTHSLRQALYYRFREQFDFLDNSENWKAISEGSNFSFCPRGYGSTSFRLFETLQLGTLPIYVWEDENWLPYTNQIDWTKFAIIIGSNELDDLPTRIKNANVPQMQQRLSEVQHMFKYNYTIQYVLRELEAEEIEQRGHTA